MIQNRLIRVAGFASLPPSPSGIAPTNNGMSLTSLRSARHQETASQTGIRIGSWGSGRVLRCRCDAPIAIRVSIAMVRGRIHGRKRDGPIVALPNGSIGDPSVRSVRPVTADGRFFPSAKKADAWNCSGSLCLLAHRVHPFHFVQAMTASKKGRLASLR